MAEEEGGRGADARKEGAGQAATCNRDIPNREEGTTEAGHRGRSLFRRRLSQEGYGKYWLPTSPPFVLLLFMNK